MKKEEEQHLDLTTKQTNKDEKQFLVVVEELEEQNDSEPQTGLKLEVFVVDVVVDQASWKQLHHS
jgi:hypothetical protein